MRKNISGFSGGMLKFNDNQVNYRIGGSSIRKSLIFNDACVNCDLAGGKVMNYDFMVGI